MFNRQFTRSRIDLAFWFALTMGSILVVFAGAIYYLTILEELEDTDRLLYKKTRVMAVNAEYDRLSGQVNLENVPLVGVNTPPIGTEIVYARWYDEQRQLFQFFGTTPSPQLLVSPGFHTISTKSVWLRQVTLPVYEDGLLIGYLQVATSLTSTQQNLAQLRIILLLAVPVTLGFIGLAGWFLGGLAMQPIQQSYTRLQRFTADASHELRAPLSAVISNAQVGIISKSSDRQSQILRFEKIVKVAKSMETLIGQLLFLARHEEALAREFLTHIDLTMWLQELADNYISPVSEHLIKIAVPPQSLKVEANPDLLYQAVTNLLNNACKYTPIGGTVELRLLKRSHLAIIQVKDSGIGIPPQDLPHIFERFYRVDKKRARKTGGFGLGLAIVQQIVQAHGGETSVGSIVGQGSTFEIRLPLTNSN
ncbi:sensor histidine kinase [Aliterella atlantica]|uniref:histidine kinase n=1 Tax=Aliterella atlantica CENA595 TaxID=1618023 RepID=A0A0D8ZLR9_9CYAN|nr:ATP-binding protein [Aliterella atlantica]KJH69379.1 histidine kinase [Aliterella atlantica CENA595]